MAQHDANNYSDECTCDLLIIGGGINGCGIARDAAGRGLSVVLAEKEDLAGATSSASTKLIHGGLRYLEYFNFRLVREALAERKTLLRAMPHISWPLRFVLPHDDDMRFESETPTSKVLSYVMPWMKGRRPGWLIRLGLFLYDHLDRSKSLPATLKISLTGTPEGEPLKDRFKMAYEYSDCWVDDSRLVVLNARDAEMRGATILVRSEVVSAEVREGQWMATIACGGKIKRIRAKMLVNATGPWVNHVIHDKLRLNSQDSVRLVRGSHIVTRRLYGHDKCYFFQGTDGRIIFAIPYEQDFTLIGTTDVEHDDPLRKPVCTDAESDYLCAFASQYFKQPVTTEDVIWSYSGVRSLCDDGMRSATAATRDYTLKVDLTSGAPILNVFGGKITTYRRLAESAMKKIGEYLPVVPSEWTANVSLPGGEFAHYQANELMKALIRDYPFLTEYWARRLIRSYGTEARSMLGTATDVTDLGRDFGATLTEAEIVWLIQFEYARTAEDILWRRSKLGLRMTDAQTLALDDWMNENLVI